MADHASDFGDADSVDVAEGDASSIAGDESPVADEGGPAARSPEAAVPGMAAAAVPGGLVLGASADAASRASGMVMPSATGEAATGTGEQLHDLLAAGLRDHDEDDGSAGEDGDDETNGDDRDGALSVDDDADGSGDGEAEELGPYVPSELPKEHCQFCGVHDPRCLVQCVRTKKWFCNSRLGSGGRGGSCIVIHLVKARLREAEPHPRSPVGGVPFKCHSCGTRNIFVLGLLPGKLVRAMAVVCRVCVTSRGPSLSALEWDVSRWEALIRERVIRQELVPPAPPEARLRMWRPTQRQLLALEELWRENADASLHDLLSAGEGGLAVTEAPGDVLLRYEDAYHYQNVLAPLVELEAAEDRRLKEGRRREDLEVAWDKAPQSGRDVLRFRFLAGEEAGHLLEGDELVASLPAGRSERRGFRAWEDKGAVRTASDGSVLLELEGGDTPAPIDVRSGFDVRFVWRDTTFARMQHSLRQFALIEHAVSAELRNALLGIAPPPPPAPGPPPPVYRVDGMPMLNGPQVAAVRTALAQPLTLIQGPPGTGKTVTSAMIVWHLVRQGGLDRAAEQADMDARLRSRSARGVRAKSLRMQAQLRAPRRRVLVAAPSNVAADNLASRIAAAGVRVVRVLARSREQVGTTVEELALHKLALTIDCPRKGTNIDQLASLASRRAAEPGSLSDAEERTFGRLLRAGERAVLDEAEAVCVTCVGAGDPRLKAMRFWALLLDEATQATEPEAIIPAVLGCRRLVLVGDHCQLGPVVQSKPASTAGLTQSLFERLIYLGVQPIRLRVQYRMHPTLAEFPSDTFYEGALQNGVSVADRVGQHDAAISWPVVGQPRAFLTCTAPEELSSSGTSYLNRGEAAAADRVVTRLLRAGVDPFRIGIITPYEGQRVHLDQMLAAGHGQLPTDRYAGLEIASVDSFQGREKDYIVVSCVRSNERQGLGFLADPRRLNVTLTRARLGLVIVGNPRVLAGDVLWNCLLNHFQARGCLFEGSFEAARPTTLKLPAPRRWVNPRYRLLLQSIATPDATAVGTPLGGQDPSAFARFGVFAATAGAAAGASEAGSHAFDVANLPPSARSMVLAAAAQAAGAGAYSSSFAAHGAADGGHFAHYGGGSTGAESGVSQAGAPSGAGGEVTSAAAAAAAAAAARATAGSSEAAEALARERGDTGADAARARLADAQAAAATASQGLPAFGVPLGAEQLTGYGGPSADSSLRPGANDAMAYMAAGGDGSGGFGFTGNPYATYSVAEPDYAHGDASSHRDDDAGTVFSSVVGSAYGTGGYGDADLAAGPGIGSSGASAITGGASSVVGRGGMAGRRRADEGDSASVTGGDVYGRGGGGIDEASSVVASSVVGERDAAALMMAAMAAGRRPPPAGLCS